MARVFEAMGMPPKVITAFGKARPRIATIGDLLALTPAELMRVPGLGPIGLGHVENILKSQKLTLAQRQIGGDAHA